MQRESGCGRHTRGMIRALPVNPGVRRFIDVPPNAFMDQSLTLEQLIPITGKNLVRGRSAAAEAFSAFQEARRAQLDVIAKARHLLPAGECL